MGQDKLLEPLGTARNSISSESLAAADFPPFRPPKKWDFRRGLAAAVKGSLLQELADTSLRLEKPATSRTSKTPEVGGLHHRYERRAA